MKEDQNIFGCFVSSSKSLRDKEIKTEHAVVDKGALFRDYIWGESGICHVMKALKHEDYGKDLLLVLFQFYVNPPSFRLERLKEVAPYRKNEKSIGIPIVVNDENFFSGSEEERWRFLKKEILSKMKIVDSVKSRHQLDTNVERLSSDLTKLLD